VLNRRPDFDRVVVVGLGIGTLASYGRPGQDFTFYEIDPAVVRLAADERYFTFLRAARADVSVVIGDGRRRLAEQPDGRADLIILDAFSSDSVPVHLLTREAVELYLAKLGPGGMLVFNISNRHLNLQPVLAQAAAAFGLAGVERLDQVSAVEAGDGKRTSHWIVLSRRPGSLQELGAGWSDLPARGDVRLWTDDYSSILGVLR
jgi:spermidine synthase